ncbi:glycosyltransferase family 29 protein [Sinorhizobium meliloti]|uniref:glycosyltransferase family 29 protein n=1 Tax=Rhizobium meliloti TaxID=382 RepID=UPI003D65DE54
MNVAVILTEFRRRTDAASWIAAADNRLSALLSECAELRDDEQLDPAYVIHLFDKFLDIERSSAKGKDPAFQLAFYKIAAKLRPKSRASHRALANAYIHFLKIDSALEHLTAYLRLVADDDVLARKQMARLMWIGKAKEDFISQFTSNAAADRKSKFHYSDELSEFFHAANLGESADHHLREWLSIRMLSEPEILGEEVRKYGDPALERAYALYLYAVHSLKFRPPKFNDASFISAFDLRDIIDGKRICMVANSAALQESKAGELIDSHDIVVRFNSYAIDQTNTGQKTDIHVSIHLHEFNLDKYVPIRIILGNAPVLWRKRVKGLKPGAQDFVGDETLRYPLFNSKLCGETPKTVGGAPTSGFNMLRLFHLFSNYSELNLIGFDSYESGAYRLEDAMALPLAAIHNSVSEKKWIEENCDVRSPLVKSVRPLERI